MTNTKVIAVRLTQAELDRIETLIERAKENAKTRGLKGTIATRKSVLMAGVDLLEQHLNKLDKDRGKPR